MTTATQVKPKLMRFQVLGGKHYATAKVTRPDGSEFESVREYDSHDPTCNIIETDIDLEERYNQPGYEKFRRLPDASTELKGFDDDAFVNEVVARGILTKEEAEKKRAELRVANSRTGDTETAAATKPEKKQHPALANLNKTPLIGLQKLAEDEEIDVTNCKTEAQYRDVIRATLTAK